MAFFTRHVVTITTDASGAGTGYTEVANGYVMSVSYVKTDYADGIDAVITGETTLTPILTFTDVNASVTANPRAATATVANAAALYAGSGVAVLDRIAVAKERIKIVVAAGGDTKTGAWHIVVGG